MAQQTTDPPRTVPEESVPAMAKEIAETVARLVRLELELVRAEATAAAKRAGIGAGLGAGALLFVLYGLGQLLGALAEIWGGWGWWISGVVLLIVAGVLGFLAMRLVMGAVNQGKAIASEVTQTLPETVRDTVEHAKETWRRTG